VENDKNIEGLFSLQSHYVLLLLENDPFLTNNHCSLVTVSDGVRGQWARLAYATCSQHGGFRMALPGSIELSLGYLSGVYLLGIWHSEAAVNSGRRRLHAFTLSGFRYRGY
jgi:hypothetical protein